MAENQQATQAAPAQGAVAEIGELDKLLERDFKMSERQ